MSKKKKPVEEEEDIESSPESEPTDESEPEPEPTPAVDPETTIAVMGSGPDPAYRLVDAPEGWNKDRVVTIDGVRHEHVDTDERGIWCYREM